MEDIRLLVQEEGRTARNLVAYHVPLDPTFDTGKTLSRKPPTSPRPAVEAKKDEIALQRCCDSPKPGLRARSASTGRDKKSALQARYWAFIFENLKRAVTEIYLTCESDESESECKEAILVLENYTREFHNLIEWLKLKSDYESTSPRQWPPSLAWGVRKSNMGQIRGMLDPSHLFGVASSPNAPDSSLPHHCKPVVEPGGVEQAVVRSPDMARGTVSPTGVKCAATNMAPKAAEASTDNCRTADGTFREHALGKGKEINNSAVINTSMKRLSDEKRTSPIVVNTTMVPHISSDSNDSLLINCSIGITQIEPDSSPLSEPSDVKNSLSESRAVGTQTQVTARKQVMSGSCGSEAIGITKSPDKTAEVPTVTNDGQVGSKFKTVSEIAEVGQMMGRTLAASDERMANEVPMRTDGKDATNKIEVITENGLSKASSNAAEEKQANEDCKTVKSNEQASKQCDSTDEGKSNDESSQGDLTRVDGATVKIKVDQASQTDMELCVEEGSEAIRFVSPLDVCIVEEKEIVPLKQPKKPLVIARPNYAAVSSLRNPPKLVRPTPKPQVPLTSLRPNPLTSTFGTRTIPPTQVPSNHFRPNVPRPLPTPTNGGVKTVPLQLAAPRPTALLISRPASNQTRLTAPLLTHRPYGRTPLLPNNRRGPPLETSPLARGNPDRQTPPFSSRRVPCGLDRRSHSTLSSSSVQSTSSVRSIQSTSSVRSWADKVRDNLRESGAPATVSVEVLPRTGASSQEDDQGWETVKGRSRSRYSPSVSRARLRFNQPTAASSLPALALSEVELCPQKTGNDIKIQSADTGKTKKPTGEANNPKEVIGDSNNVKKPVIYSNNIKKAVGNTNINNIIIGEAVVTKKGTGDVNNIKITVGEINVKNVVTNLNMIDDASTNKKIVEDSNITNHLVEDAKNTAGDSANDNNTKRVVADLHKPKTGHKKSPTHERNTEKETANANSSNTAVEDSQKAKGSHKKSPTHEKNTEKESANANNSNITVEDSQKAKGSHKKCPTHEMNLEKELAIANSSNTSVEDSQKVKGNHKKCPTHETNTEENSANVHSSNTVVEDVQKARASHKKSPMHEKSSKDKSNTRERSKSRALEEMKGEVMDKGDVEDEDMEMTTSKTEEKEEAGDIHSSDLEAGLDPRYEDILQEGEQLSHEEAELRREIQELETTDIEVDTETEDEETREERELRRNSRSCSVEGDSKGDIEAGEEEVVGVDDSEEIESLEARYETVLVGMTWAERMDTLEQLQEYVSRHPGRATELHQKLSSPSRRKTLAETLRKFQLKQAQAQEKREMMQRAKAQRLKDLHDRVAEVKVMQEANIAKRRVLLERKLKNAECRRNLHLKGIVRKAHDEEQKVKELAFITELEAQNKRIDFINQCQKQEVLVQGIYEERQRKLEEKAAKEAAVEERRRLLEAEWQEKIERMQEQRREREERMGRAQQEKEKSRKEQAREKARDREERLSALHAAQMATVEELQKKIQQKQEESARRHEENMEHIRQRALESSILRTDDVAPRIQPYPVQKMCGICHVLIGSEVYLLSHLRGRTHQEAVLKLHEGAGKEDIPMLNIRHIVDAPADKLDPRLALDKKRQAALKKRCKKIRQRMAARGREFENSHETPANVDAPNKPRINKSLKDIEKLSNSQGKGQWPNNAITALERGLGEINRILAKPRSQPDQTAFQSLGGFTTVANILSLGLDVPPNMAPYLPSKCYVTACTTLTLACKNHPLNSAYLLLSNKVTTVLDLLLSRLAVLIPGGAPGSSPGRLAVDALGDALMRLLALVLSVAAPDSDQVSVRVQDVISYTVCVGVVDKLALYCGGVRDPIEGDPGLLLSGLDLLTTLTARCRSTKGDPTQLLVTLQLTELVGAVSMLYGMLLHQGAPPRGSPPAPLAPHATEVALATVTLLSRVAELDLNIFQNVLGAEGISLQFRHIASYLLWFCSHDHGNDELLHAVVRVVGFFAVNHRDNQMMLQSGYTPTVLQQLCSLPLEYFRVPLNGLLFPTLLACCADNEENRAILEQEVCYESLEEFKCSDAAAKNTLMQLLAGGKSSS